MGNAKNTQMVEDCTQKNRIAAKLVCESNTAHPPNAGVVWQDAADDFGDQVGGFDLSGAKKLKFWARGDKGDESVTFKFGVLGPDEKYPDSTSGDNGAIKLTKEWKEYSIDLEGKDLTHIKTGFVWSLAGQGQPLVFFLDEIRQE